MSTEKDTPNDKFSAPSKAKSPQENTLPSNIVLPNKPDLPAWNNQGMKVDNTHYESRTLTESTKGLEESQQMEEEQANIDIGELDLLELEMACKTNNYEKIPARQLENLEVILSRE